MNVFMGCVGTALRSAVAVNKKLYILHKMCMEVDKFTLLVYKIF